MTLTSVGFRRSGVLAILAVTFISNLSAAPILQEDFASVPGGLTGAGWVITNNSSPVGTTSWFQGDPATFNAQAGASDSYASANFNAADFGGNINLFLITPSINYVGDVVVSFWTRTTTGGGGFGDNLEFLLNPTGTTSTAGFSLSLNSTPPSYPDDWTQVTVNATLTGPSRFAFRYNVLDTSVSGNFIGIDTFSVDSVGNAVPEPGTYVISSLGLFAMAVLRRRGV